MKKAIALFLALTCVLTLGGCAQKKEAEPAGEDPAVADEAEPVVPSRSAVPETPVENGIPVIMLTETGEVLEPRTTEESPEELSTEPVEASGAPTASCNLLRLLIE